MISNAAVVDTNIILSALISKSSGIREKLFDETMNYFAPNFIIIELYKHKEKLLKYSKLDEPEFFEYFSSIVNRNLVLWTFGRNNFLLSEACSIGSLSIEPLAPVFFPDTRDNFCLSAITSHFYPSLRKKDPKGCPVP